MRISQPWVIAFLAISLAGVGVDAVRARRNTTPTNSPYASLHDAFGSLKIPASDTAPVVAALVLQAGDCTGNFRMIDLLHRSEIRDDITLAVIWYLGPVDDTLIIRASLPKWTSRVALKPVPPDVVQELGRLGHQSSPVLIMLDWNGRIRFTSQSPRTPREFAGLKRVITGLTWSEGR